MTAVDSLALLAEAEALDKAATPGPWDTRDGQWPTLVRPIRPESDECDPDWEHVTDLDDCITPENRAFIARARTLLPALAAALRPFTAPVGVEAFEGLRRACRCGSLRQRAGTCRCGADAHNALLDQCIAAHVAALGEVERLKAEARKAVDLLAAAGGALSVEGPAIPELAKNCDATARAISAALKGDQ